MNAFANELNQIFYEEADELILRIECLLLTLDINAPNSQVVNALHRTAHTLKGAAANCGFHDISQVSYGLEMLFSKLAKHQVRLSDRHADTLRNSKEVLASLLNHHRDGAEADWELMSEIEAEIASMTGLQAAVRNTKPAIEININQHAELAA